MSNLDNPPTFVQIYNALEIVSTRKILVALRKYGRLKLQGEISLLIKGGLGKVEMAQDW